MDIALRKIYDKEKTRIRNIPKEVGLRKEWDFYCNLSNAFSDAVVRFVLEGKWEGFWKMESKKYYRTYKFLLGLGKEKGLDKVVAWMKNAVKTRKLEFD